MKTTNKQFDLVDMAGVLNINPHVLREKLRELEVINKPKVKDSYLLTEIAKFFGLGEIKTIVTRKGFALYTNSYNLEETRKILNYDMPLSKLYESMYPAYEEEDVFEAECIEGQMEGDSRYLLEIELMTALIRHRSKYSNS